MKRRILFVDDEPSLLQGLRRGLREMRHQWELEFAEGGPQALEAMSRAEPAVVVADIRMPGMDGIELLHEVKRRCPGAVRLTLSGSDDSLLRRAVGVAHHCLLKPCQTEAIRATVERALWLGELLAKIRQATLGPGGEGTSDLNRAVEGVLAVSRSEWSEAAELTASLAPEPLLVPLAPEDLTLLVLNLVTNAVQAIEDAARGRGAVSARTRRLEEGLVELRVSDTGIGISESIRPKVFEPFFTTKKLGRGTGQGLAIVRSLASGCGGTVGFETPPDQGATFIVRIPPRGAG